MRGMITRRRMLRTSAATGVGLLAAGSGFRVLGQDNQNLDLPEGSAGKLTVIHRTEYFEEAQNLFRQVVTDFAAANGAELDISTTNPESFGDFLGKMTAAVKAGNPPDFAYTSNVSISQMHLLDLRRGRDRRGRRGGQPATATSCRGINAEKTGQFDGRWKAIPFLAGTHRLLHPRRQAQGKGHRSGDA